MSIQGVFGSNITRSTEINISKFLPNKTSTTFCDEKLPSLVKASFSVAIKKVSKLDRQKVGSEAITFPYLKDLLHENIIKVHVAKAWEDFMDSG